MASDFPELSLDLSPPIPAISSKFPEFFTRFLVAGISNSGELSKLNDFVNGLEDELKKIQAFQRELPISFLVLNDAISKLKEVLNKNEEKRRDDKFDGSAGVKLGIEEFEKKTWMSSAQLWSSTTEEGGDYEPRKFEDKGEKLSFTKAAGVDVARLSLVPPGLENSAINEPGSVKSRTGGIFPGSVFSTVVDQKARGEIKPPYQMGRKRRRCWSPELHRRFVDALESLGGSEVATPKQIKELMQVDGLTNDEVKSHLQKYRLHVRKLPAATPASMTTGLSGDVEMDCGYQFESGMDVQHSSSPKGPLQLKGSRKCNSSCVEEDEEEKSDGQSWKVQPHHV